MEKLEEWKRRDPNLLDLEGFQKFMEGMAVPASEDELFYEVGTQRFFEPQPWCGQGMGIRCWPVEHYEDIRRREDYCENMLVDIVFRHFPNLEKLQCKCHAYENFTFKRLRGLFLNHCSAKDGYKVGDVEFSKEFIEDCWLHVEHPKWYGRYPSDIKRMLALCVKLGVGEEAYEFLNKGEGFPHADEPRDKGNCDRMAACPILKFRGWLETTEIQIPQNLLEEVPKVKEWVNKLKRTALAYREAPFWDSVDGAHYPRFIANWKIRRRIWELQHTPPCQNCGNLIDSMYVWGCDSWKKDMETGLCSECRKFFGVEEGEHERGSLDEYLEET